MITFLSVVIENHWKSITEKKSNVPKLLKGVIINNSNSNLLWSFFIKLYVNEFASVQERNPSLS